MEHLLSETGQPTKTDMWELKLKGLVDRVQMLHPQLLRLLVQAGVVGGDVDHCGRVLPQQGLSPWSNLGAIGNLRCAFWIPCLVFRNAGVGDLGWAVFLHPVVFPLALGPYPLPNEFWVPPVTPPIAWT